MSELRETITCRQWKECETSGVPGSCLRIPGKLYPGQRTPDARSRHKRMEMIGKGDDSMFVCSCGHKERLSKFQERRKKEGGGVSKRDVHAYMKKQQKEAKEPVNSAFADALKNIRLN